MNAGTPTYATIEPWKPPITAPIARPASSAMIQVQRFSRPSHCGSHSTCRIAMAMPRAASIEPTDRSMLRDTMTSTMPVAMIADDRGLDREVPEVARGEEGAPGQHVQHDPDDDQRHDHPEQPRVDLQAAQERAGRGALPVGGGASGADTPGSGGATGTVIRAPPGRNKCGANGA